MSEKDDVKKKTVVGVQLHQIVSHAHIFAASDGRISIEYFDEKRRWAEMSGGLDEVTRLKVEKGEAQEVFFKRLKEYVWENYLKPTPERFGRLCD